MKSVLEKLLNGGRVVPPTMRYKAIGFPEYKKIHSDSIRDLAGFWAREAKQLIWERPWDKVLVGQGPESRWFVGGKLSAYKNVIERHRNTWVWDKVAIIWEGEEEVARVLTYGELHDLVISMSKVLRGLGVRGHDWVMFYAPPMPEVIAAALASVRLGAPFEFVFTGFGAFELRERLMNRRPRVLITVDAFPRKGRPVMVKDTVDKALGDSGLDVKVVVMPRLGVDIKIMRGRDYYLDEVPTTDSGETYVHDANDPLFGIHAGYDSGSRPLTHGAGGYLTQTYSTTRWMGLRPRDTYLCTVMPGWITGITYVLFGPFMVGSTVVIYEGGPDYPHWDRWWSILERYAVTVFLTTGGALRILSRQDAGLLRAHNLDMLRLVLTTAEPLEVSVWRWAYEYVGTGTVPTIDSIPSKLSGRVPIIHMFIQSEFGTFVTGSLPNYTFVPLVPGSVGPPMPGFDFDVVDGLGNSVRSTVGYLVTRSPWPAMPIEYPIEFVRRWVNGVYYVGDYALMDYDMNIYAVGRSDAVMKINGYRVSPGDLESALRKVPGVRKVVVAGSLDEQKFEVPFVLIEGDVDEATVRRVIRAEVGPIADPGRVVITRELPDIPVDELRMRLKQHLWGIVEDPVIKGLIGS